MNKKKITKGIQSWPKRERPRERLIQEGSASLSDSQLLAILLRTGRPNSSAVQVSLELLDHLKGLSEISNITFEELSAIPGIGMAKAAQIQAAIELGKRALSTPLTHGIRIKSSQDLFRHYFPLLRHLRYEIFKVIYLDAKHGIIRDATVSKGSLTISIAHPREVFGGALKSSAAAVILLHNHPSGDPVPSEEDHLLTQRMVDAGKLLGIHVLDHLIIGDGKYVSFADQGWISV